MESESGIHYLNVSYFFRLLYDLFTGGGEVTGGSFMAGVVLFIGKLWIFITFVGFVVAVFALGVLIHATLRLREAAREDAVKYRTIDGHAAEVKRDHSRWAHVISLIESPNESDWRQAIIEADIMLDDLLSQLGYHGQSVGEKLKAVNPARFHTLQNAWEAHKVRNEIAHQGSAFPLSDHLAYRTIQHYEAVMREHGEI